MVGAEMAMNADRVTEIVKMIKLHPTQQLVADSKARFRLVRHGRRWGGTTLCVVEALRHARENRGSMVAIAVPFKRMARSINWPTLKRFVDSKEILTINSSAMRLHMTNGSTVMLVSAESDCDLCGIGLDFISLDVAGMMKPEFWFSVVRPTLVDRAGGALFCYTPPYDKRGVERAMILADMESIEREDWEKFHFKSEDSPYFPSEALVGAQEEMGEEVFRADFLAEWPT